MSRKLTTLLMLMVFGVAPLCAQPVSDSLSYAFGVYYGISMRENNITSISPDDFMRGLKEAFTSGTNNVSMSKEQAVNLINSYLQKKYEEMAEQNLIDGQKFLQGNRTKEGIITDASGLQYKVVRLGSGAKPKATDVVKVHYTGYSLDGTVFDSSVERGEPAQFPLNKVIKGWTIGVQFMSVGSKYIFYIPSDLAYGANPQPGGPIQPNEVLVFEIELLDIVQ